MDLKDVEKRSGRGKLLLLAITAVVIGSLMFVSAPLTDDNNFEGATLERGGYLLEYSAGSYDTTIVGRTSAFSNGDVTLPSSFTYTLTHGRTVRLNIVAIGDDAFAGMVSINSVVIPSSVKTIGEGAFRGCVNLATVNIPFSVTTIGDFAFYGCTSLYGVDIADGDGTLTIGHSAFRNTDLYNITLPSSVTDIGECSFMDTVLESLWINDGDKALTIQDSAFNGLTQLYSNGIHLPARVTDIASAAFSGTGIDIIALKHGTTYIWQDSFPVGTIYVIYSDMEYTTASYASGTTIITTNITPEKGHLVKDMKVIIQTASITATQGSSDTIWSFPGQPDGEYHISATYNEPSFHHVVNDGEATITGGTHIRGVIEIPAELGGAPVTKIWDDAFSGAPITSVILPNTIRLIEGGSFADCTGLKELTVPIEAVISENAFDGCVNINKITFTGRTNGTMGSGIGIDYTPSGITNLPWYLSKANLTTVVFDSNVKHIGNNLLNGCSNIETVIFGTGSKLDSIGDQAFKVNSSLRSFVIPEGTTKIGTSAFAQTGFPTIVIPSSVNTIGANAFQDNTALYSVRFAEGSNLQIINSGIFSGCTSLYNVNVPDSVYDIRNDAFSNTDMGVLYFPEGVTIGTQTGVIVINYSDMYDVDIFMTGTTVNVSADVHYPVKSLIAAVDDGSGNKATVTETTGGWTFNAGTDTRFFIYFRAPAVEYRIVDAQNAAVSGSFALSGAVTIDVTYEGRRVTLIDADAFKDNTSITELTIPIDAVITAGAFTGCTGISKITLSGALGGSNGLNYTSTTVVNTPWYINKDSLLRVVIGPMVRTIGDYMFYECESLESITLESSILTSIGRFAFSGTAIASIALPASVTNIDSTALSGTSGLRDITVASGNITYKVADGVLLSYDGSTLVHYPAGRVGTTTFIPSTVETIGNDAFRNSKAPALVIPANVKRIGDYAFLNCKGFTDLTIPATVTSIGEGAFFGCTGLKTMDILATLSVIETYTFSGCSNLEKLTLPSSITTIGDNAFNLCGKLTRLAVPAEATLPSSYPATLVMVLYSGTVESVTAWTDNDDQVYLDIVEMSGVNINGIKFKTDPLATGTDVNDDAAGLWFELVDGTTKTYYLEILSGTFAVTLTIAENVSYKYKIYGDDEYRFTSGGVIAVPTGVWVTVSAIVPDTYNVEVGLKNAPLSVFPDKTGADITGADVLSVKVTPKEYDVNVTEGNTYITWNAKAKYGTDYTFTKTMPTAILIVTVTIGPKVIDTAVSSGSYTIKGTDITGDVSISVKVGHIVNVEGVMNGTLEYTLDGGSRIQYAASFVTVTGSVIVLYPAPNEGYFFETTDDSGASWTSETSFTMTTNVTVRFSPNEYTVTKAFDTGISVTSSEAVAKFGYNFNFNVNSGGKDVIIVVVVGAKTVTPMKGAGTLYTIPAADVKGEIIITVRYTYNVSFTDGHGTLKYKINDNAAEAYSAAFAVVSTDKVEFVPSPENGYGLRTSVDGTTWTKDLVFNGLTSDITAKFVEETYTVTKDVGTGITVTVDPTAMYNTDLEFTVTAPGEFGVSVTVGGVLIKAPDLNGTGNSYTLAGSAITGNIVITVVTEYTLELTGSNGALKYKIGDGPEQTYSAKIVFPLSAAVTLIPTPDTGYVLKSSIDGGMTWRDTVTFSAGSGNIVVKFVLKVYTVTKTAGDGISVSVADSIEHGKELKFTVTTTVDVEVIVKVDGVEKTKTVVNNEYTLAATNVTGNITIDVKAVSADTDVNEGEDTGTGGGDGGSNTIIFIAAGAVVAVVALAAVYFLFIRKP